MPDDDPKQHTFMSPEDREVLKEFQDHGLSWLAKISIESIKAHVNYGIPEWANVSSLRWSDAAHLGYFHLDVPGGRLRISVSYEEIEELEGE